MKRITNFLMLLLLAMCGIGASAQTTVSIVDGSKNPIGVLNTKSSDGLTLTSTATAGMAGVTVTIGSGAYDQATAWSTRVLTFKPGTAKTAEKLTITAPNGYVIKDYSIILQAWSSSTPYLVSSTVDEDDIVSNGTSITGASAVTFSKSDIGTQSTNLTFYQNSSSINWLGVKSFTVTLIEEGAEEREYNYSYTQYDATSFTELGSGSGSTTGYTSGYTFTAPSISGYALLGAYDATSQAELDLSSTITATNIVLLYSPILTDLANASSAKAYTMAAPRGYYNVASADASVFRATAGTPDYTDSNNYWTFVTVDGNTYLYNVTAGKFASTGAALVTSAPATLSAVSSGSSTNPLVLKMTEDGTTYTMNMDGNCNVFVNSWATADDGNMLQIAEIPGVTVTPDVYKVNFTNTTGSLTSVYVDGTEVTLGTDVILTSGATVSSGATTNAIETYNGYATLAEALADANFAGTVDVALPATLTTVTLNVTRDNRVVKTVAIENLPENTEIDVVSALGGTPNYVSNISPTTVTSTDVDQTVTVTYDSSLPFELSADPTDATTSTAYLMTLRQKYTDGNTLVSSSVANVDLADNGYYWTFGGNEWDGITVYNRGEGGYMTVQQAGNSQATFEATPTAYNIASASNETNGFNLNLPGTTVYLNDNGNNGIISTWWSTWGAGDDGSCFKVYSIKDAVLTLIDADITPYFLYPGYPNSISEADALANANDYDALYDAPTYEGYLALKATLAALDKVEVTEGYYLVRSAYDAFFNEQGEKKAMYYDTSSNTIKWKTADGTAPYVLKLEATGNGTYYLYAPLGDVYLSSKAGATVSDAASALVLEVNAANPASVTLVYGTSTYDAALHTAGHSSGAGESGNLTGWTTDSEASMWRLMPVGIDEITLISPEGVIDGEEVMQGFANDYIAQLPLTMGVYTITEDMDAGARLETIESNQVAASVGYIISGVKGKTYALLPPENNVEEPAGNLLVAGDGSVVSGGYILAYKKGEAEAKFWPINGLTVPANRSYLPEGAPTRGLENIFGGIGEDVTGINGITTGAENGTVYDLQGRRVNNATKGVYIINGKKVIK